MRTHYFWLVMWPFCALFVWSSAKMESIRASKAPRRKNFTDLECNMIIEGISMNREAFIGKFSASVTKETKGQAWEDLTWKINAACGYDRTVKEVEKKWYNLQQMAVKEVSHFSKEIKKTGEVYFINFHIIFIYPERQCWYIVYVPVIPQKSR